MANADFIGDIISGVHDHQLEEMSEAIRQRKKLKRTQNTAMAMVTMKVGDVVILKGLNPKYINGLRGKVVDLKRTKISVMLDEGQYTGRFGRRVVCPANCLDRV
jgi:preprotein translocase subunit YajC